MNDNLFDDLVLLSTLLLPDILLLLFPNKKRWLEYFFHPVNPESDKDTDLIGANNLLFCRLNNNCIPTNLLCQTSVFSLFVDFLSGIYLTTLAGRPTAIVHAGISFVTRE